jgi:hypothetical protein
LDYRLAVNWTVLVSNPARLRFILVDDDSETRPACLP